MTLANDICAKNLVIALVIILATLISGCASEDSGNSDSSAIDSTAKDNNASCNLSKINFDLEEIDNNGLRGPPDGKVSIDYEFCIPEDEDKLQEINRIDADIRCESGSRGRIGCSASEYLCIGNTGMKDFKRILCNLSVLDYVERMDETFWE